MLETQQVVSQPAPSSLAAAAFSSQSHHSTNFRFQGEKEKMTTDPTSFSLSFSSPFPQLSRRKPRTARYKKPFVDELVEK